MGKIVHQRRKNAEAIVAAKQCLARSFRMGHHAEDIAAFVDDARNVRKRTIRIAFSSRVAVGVHVAKDNLAICL